jgi:hypothetical protein
MTTLIINGTLVAVVPTSPDGYEHAALAVQRDLGRQWRGHPIPGNAAVDSWTATGGTIHCNELVGAAYAAADPSLTEAVVDLVLACEAAAQTFRWYEELHEAKGPEHADKAARNRSEAEKLEAILERVKVTEDGDAG